MTDLDFAHCYGALRARDERFDGQFFVTVRTTGIYCRPSCPAITPKAENVEFVVTAAAAQQGGYRACRRCLPDAVPGSPRWNMRSDLASRAMRLIGDGMVDRDGVEGLAATLGYSSRQLNRMLTAELGAGPLALARAHRATTARILIERTSMPMSDIAFAAGFSSIRQFNDTIAEVFAATPSHMRDKGQRRYTPADTPGTLSLRLAVRQPFSPQWLWWFLSGHAIDGLEKIHLEKARNDADHPPTFIRTLATPSGPTVVALTCFNDHVDATIDTSDIRDVGAAVHRVRRMLDLDADSAAIDQALAADPHYARMVGECPGIRLPGSPDPFETLMRTMIGQQISLAAARTHGARLVTTLGNRIDGTDDLYAFPTATAIAERGHEVLRGPTRRVESIIRIAAAVADGSLQPHEGMLAPEMRAQLLAQKGIGPWTADYLTMRVLGDPDVLLDTDLVLRKRADALGIDLSQSAAWAPWRSYASMHLWRDALAESVPELRAAASASDDDPEPDPGSDSGSASHSRPARRGTKRSPATSK